MVDPFMRSLEAYPRADLRLSVTRREALLRPLTEHRVHEGERQGGSGHKLSSLGTLEPELLELIRPGVTDDAVVLDRQGWIAGSAFGGEPPVNLFAADSPAALVLRRFDGLTMLRDIARDLAGPLEHSELQPFPFVRGVFLHLVSRGICMPR